MLNIPGEILVIQNDHTELVDWVDRLSSVFTCSLLVAFSIIAASSLFVGSSIECMPPANTPDTWNNYFSQYCYVQPNSFVLTDLHGSDNYIKRQISFYPWVPFALMAQAVMFYLPKFLWEAIVCKFGIDVKSIINEVKRVQDKPMDEYYKALRELAVYISAYLDYIYSHGRPRCFILSSPTVMLYLAKKWIFFLNALIQFFLICMFVGGGNYAWGFESVGVSLKEMSLIKSPIFPFMTYCSIPINIDNMKEKRNMPCLMGMNVVFEKIYVFLYFWTMFMCLITFAHAVVVTSGFCVPNRRVLKLCNYLKTSGFKFHKAAVHHFLNDVLRADGLLALLMIEDAFGDIPTEFLMRELWLYNKTEYGPKTSELKLPLIDIC